MTHPVSIHWFRQDLRLADNPALSLAAENTHVVPIYILDDGNAADFAMGEASRWWLHHSLKSLNDSLGGALSLYRGNPMDILCDIVNRIKVKAIYWNRCYEPWQMERDAKIKRHFRASDIEVTSTNSALLWEPWTIKKPDGAPYSVFTPFYRKGCLLADPPRKPLSVPEKVEYHQDKDRSIDLTQLDLLPGIRWDKQLEPHWKIGEKGAYTRFHQFLEEGLGHYKTGRNLPAERYVSKLSPYLHFGEISPNELWHTVNNLGRDKNTDHFCSELGWREFSYSLLFEHPNLPTKNLQQKFNNFPWVENEAFLNAWQNGQTGIPMVDAGMRELWQTGYMHNRMRMIVGSFLTKNLNLHWQHGARWFWDTLVDADLANNSASWQWVAGCGADAARYIRIFNPVTQGPKFDPDGSYVRKYIPEIAALPDNFLFNPWEAPEQILNDANIKLGTTYPNPVVDLNQTRMSAQQAFDTLEQES